MQRKYQSILVSSALALGLQPGFSQGQNAGLPAHAKLVVGDVHKYDEVLPACSPDGRWLAFEYHEMSNPNYPQVAVIRLGQNDPRWHSVLKRKPGRHLYAGDFSWSPDSRWLAVITDSPKDSDSFLSESNTQLVKVNIYSHEVVRLTNFAPSTSFGSTTAWLRSGLIVFSAVDDNIYGIPENGGEIRKLVKVPTERCGGGISTFGVSPDERAIAFAMGERGEGQIEECNALWIAQLRSANLRRFATTGLQPLNPFWLDDDTILFAGVNVKGGKWLPKGLYKLSVQTGKVVRLVDGPFMTPFVGDSGKTLYFSWRSKLQKKSPFSKYGSWVNPLYGFQVWKVPLRDVLPQPPRTRTGIVE